MGAADGVDVTKGMGRCPRATTTKVRHIQGPNQKGKYLVEVHQDEVRKLGP